MPQKWRTHWPIRDAAGEDVAPDDGDPLWLTRKEGRSRAVDRIGNLTLVTGFFNQAVSNLGWAVKRPEFQKQRSLVLNYAVAESETWDEARIEARGQALAQAANRSWPAPDTLLSDLGKPSA